MTPPPNAPGTPGLPGSSSVGSSTGGAASGQGMATGTSKRETPVNLERLADKVYRLMLADLSTQIRRNSGERR